MSGGSWDYVHSVFQRTADNLSTSKISLRRALGKRIELIAKAMHDIEWVDSSDYSDGDDEEAIKKAIGEGWPSENLEVVLQDAKRILLELRMAITEAKAAKK